MQHIIQAPGQVAGLNTNMKFPEFSQSYLRRFWLIYKQLLLTINLHTPSPKIRIFSPQQTARLELIIQNQHNYCLKRAK